MRHPRDEAIVAGLRDGDEDAVADLVRIFGPRVFSLALQKLKNREDAEEVTQDVLLKVIDLVVGLRVSREAETEGLDMALHGEAIH